MQLGGDRGVVLSVETRTEGNTVRTAKAQNRAVDLLPLIEEIRSTGATTLQAIADELNAKRVATARDGTSAPVQVSRVLARAA